ncbi:hypothetical protein HK101_011788 [Irineochytrium annulatum]|nr:hypothetical protein HK101_011788 [Irineochytrium annulatum]
MCAGDYNHLVNGAGEAKATFDASPPPAAPRFSPLAHSALLKKLAPRLTPLRLQELTAIALADDRPTKPPPGACCGSSCDPCVLTLYGQELKIWKECQGAREEARKRETEGVVAEVDPEDAARLGAEREGKDDVRDKKEVVVVEPEAMPKGDSMLTMEPDSVKECDGRSPSPVCVAIMTGAFDW